MDYEGFLQKQPLAEARLGLGSTGPLVAGTCWPPGTATEGTIQNGLNGGFFPCCGAGAGLGAHSASPSSTAQPAAPRRGGP